MSLSKSKYNTIFVTVISEKIHTIINETLNLLPVKKFNFFRVAQEHKHWLINLWRIHNTTHERVPQSNKWWQNEIYYNWHQMFQICSQTHNLVRRISCKTCHNYVLEKIWRSCFYCQNNVVIHIFYDFCEIWQSWLRQGGAKSVVDSKYENNNYF